MATISIRNLKSISELEFDIPGAGVYVMTGINGSGKTTLLACLERLANSNAFQRHFRTSSSDQFDNFRTSQISYTHNHITVQYVYRNTRWSPSPRNNASILSTLGFSEVLYLTSSGERFYVQNNELDTKAIVSSPQYFKDAMNYIFETAKYNDLRRVKLSGRGRGFGRLNYGFVMPLPPQGGQSRYFTEKNFSLGEILMLNALFELQNVKNNSLILIDEVELALHPRVQVKFLKFLQTISTTKNATVIISTHSSSLIKSAPKLIYLERNTAGKVNVEYDCYPAIALQNVAVQEEVQPDVVFFVEDQFAKYLLDEMLNYYFHNIYQNRRPIIKTLPVGGWGETIRFTEASAIYLIPANTQLYCFLDLDVQPQLQNIQAKANRTVKEQEQLTLYINNQQRVKFLPITAELGIVTLLNNNPNQHILPLQTYFNDVFDIAQIIIDEAQRGLNYSPNPRDTAKIRLLYYVDRIRQATNKDINAIKIKLCQYFIQNHAPANQGNFQAVFNPIFN